MNKLRRIVFWGHLAIGVSAGIVIFIMAVTGVILAFERPVLSLTERKMVSVDRPEGSSRLGPEEILAKASQFKPGIKPSGLTLNSDPSAAATVAVGREGVLFLNPYTGEVLGQGAVRTRGFFHLVEDWHRWLGLAGDNRPLGKNITGACNAGFLLLAISGVYLWWPKSWRWRRIKAVILFQRGLKGRARDFNWHNTIGFWSSVFLIIITASGMTISYQWATNLLYRAMGSQPPAPQVAPGSRPAPGSPSAERSRSQERPAGIPENLNHLWSRAEQQANSWRSVTLRLPVQANAPVAFSIREGNSWLEAASSQLTLNQGSAEVVKWEPYAASSRGRRARTWARFLHTGEAVGVVGQILAGLASLGGSVLVFTGLGLAVRRFRSWLRQRQASRRRVDTEIPLFDARRRTLSEETQD
jgi:uncharacterized iron-regulated membrane protein